MLAKAPRILAGSRVSPDWHFEMILFSPLQPSSGTLPGAAQPGNMPLKAGEAILSLISSAVILRNLLLFSFAIPHRLNHLPEK
jgi:hypothetical protein